MVQSVPLCTTFCTTQNLPQFSGNAVFGSYIIPGTENSKNDTYVRVRVRVRVCVHVYVWVCRFAVPLYRFCKSNKIINLLGTKCGTDWYETDLLMRGRVRRGDPGVRVCG